MRIATATPEDNQGTVYTVTYSDTSACDMNVRYEYLRGLARQGYRVEVAASPAEPAHVIDIGGTRRTV